MHRHQVLAGVKQRRIQLEIEPGRTTSRVVDDQSAIDAVKFSYPFKQPKASE
jgi:hypothetical protein